MIEIMVAGTELMALIDDDLGHLARYRWRVNDKGVVFRYGDKRVKLSHVIAGSPPAGFGVIHADGNRMDFRRCNLAVEPASKYLKRARAKRKGRSSAQGDLFKVGKPSDGLGVLKNLTEKKHG